MTSLMTVTPSTDNNIINRGVIWICYAMQKYLVYIGLSETDRSVTEILSSCVEIGPLLDRMDKNLMIECI